MLRLLIIIVIAGLVGYYVMGPMTGNESDLEQSSAAPEQSADSVPQQKSVSHGESSVFVPYWTISANSVLDEKYSYLIYFGVAADENGIIQEDPGYAGLSRFLKFAGNTPKYLTIRMVDSETNSAVLRNKSAQKKIISESIKTAQDNGFDGIVLDFEMSSIAFEAVTNRVTSFYTDYSQAVKAENMPFYVTLYGDTYYRVRPYEVKKISEMSDQVLIMAYDFHKARGNPGPNFPLKGKEMYGYDFETMMKDFMKDVPQDKITIIFGMFGYDWRVDRDDKSVGMGDGKSTREIEQSVIRSCDYVDCQHNRDKTSGETEASYIDTQGRKHIVWYEDNDSVKTKIEFLDKLGITSYSYWAYTYY